MGDAALSGGVAVPAGTASRRSHAPGPFAFADRERTRGILAEAGFRDIAIETFDGQMRLGASPEHAALLLTSLMGPRRAR